MKRFRAANRATRIAVVLFVVLGLGALGAGIYALAAGLSAPTITSHPSNPTNSQTATFSFISKDKNVTFQCSIDTGAWLGCGTANPGTKSYTGLGAGAHVFQVRAVSGTQTSPATSYSWTIDRTPPTVSSIVRAGPNPTNASSVSWTVTFSEPVTGVDITDFRLAVTGLVGPVVTSVSGSGSTYTASASTGIGTSGSLGLNMVNDGTIHDIAGNQLASTGFTGPVFVGQVFTIDRVPPPAPVLDQYPPNPSPTANATFAWHDTESGVTFQCSIEGGTWTSCSSPASYTVDITKSDTHQFGVRALDAAGNISPATSYSWKTSKVGFTINGSVSGLAPGLYRSIPLTIYNPNAFTIYVTSITVSATGNPNGCAASQNVDIRQSPVSSSHTVAVPARSTVTLAGADQPQIALKNLNTNQDNCKGQTFALSYGGTATK